MSYGPIAQIVYKYLNLYYLNSLSTTSQFQSKRSLG
jgi:hypothetical protein